MATKYQIIFEGVAESNHGIPVLKFRNPLTGKDTPSFMLNVKESSSYSKWAIKMKDFEGSKNRLAKAKELFEEAISCSEYEIVFMSKDKLVVDGEMLLKIIEHIRWVDSISCDEADFSVSSKDVKCHIFGARRVEVVFG